MRRNSKAKLVVSFLFVAGLFVLAYFLLRPYVSSLLETDKTELEGKKIQYRLAYNVRGDKTQIIHLNKGDALFEYYHEGAGSFFVDLRTNDGKLIKVLADTKGDYEGKTELQVPETDAYLLTVKTTGVWGLDFK
ncbi:MAG: hypothetical protein LWX07_10465 [Bacteroidetes bacterium]|nr:hypothetical protein [Bacteroidota bacterium]